MKLSLFNGFVLASLLLGAIARADFIPMDVIDPVDEENLGTLNVVLPQVTAPYSLASTEMSSGSKKFGVPFRLLAGDHRVSFNVSILGVVTSGMLKIEKKRQTILTLGAFNASWDSQPLLVNVGPKAEKIFTSISGGPNSHSGSAFNNIWMHRPNVLQPLPPGTKVTIATGIPALGSHTFEIVSGELRDEKISWPDQRSFLEIVPSKRVFPDVYPTCAGDRRIFVVQRRAPFPGAADREPHWHDVARANAASHHDIESYLQMNGEAPSSVVYFSTPVLRGLQEYELVVSNVSRKVDLKIGQRMSVTIPRIDVNHVKVTREDGTTYMVAGNYQVYREEAPGGNWVPILLKNMDTSCYVRGSFASFPTRTGIDVLPGKYRVVITYATSEGGKTQEHILDLN